MLINGRRFKIFLFFLLCIISGLTYAYFEARDIHIKKTVYSNNDLPDVFVGKKIVFISDTHLDYLFTKNDLNRLVNQINGCSPDMVFLGGDYTRKNSVYSQSFFSEIAKLKSKYGVYFVLGNHDHWEDAELIRQGLINCGFKDCDNQSYWIREGNDSIKVGGVGDFWEDIQIVENTTDDISSTDFCILLSHNPDYIEKLDSDRVDLMLSGHTHAGQITFFGFYAPIMPSTMHPEFLQTGQKYRYGWKKKDGIDLYVSSGVGMGGVPFRFFARPEIVEITLDR